MTILEVEEVRVAEYPSNDIVMAVVNRTRKLHSFGVNEKPTNWPEEQIYSALHFKWLTMFTLTFRYISSPSETANKMVKRRKSRVASIQSEIYNNYDQFATKSVSK